MCEPRRQTPQHCPAQVGIIWEEGWSHTWMPWVWKVDREEDRDTKPILSNGCLDPPTRCQRHAECDLGIVQPLLVKGRETPARPVPGGSSQLVLLSESTRHWAGARSTPDECGHATCARCCGACKGGVHLL